MSRAVFWGGASIFFILLGTAPVGRLEGGNLWCEDEKINVEKIIVVRKGSFGIEKMLLGNTSTLCRRGGLAFTVLVCQKEIGQKIMPHKKI